MPDLIPLRLVFLMAAVLCLCGCPDTPYTPPQPSETRLGPVELLAFFPDEDHFLQLGHRFPLEPGLPLKEAIQQLADQLSRTYFTDGEPASGIRIDVLGLYTIDLPHRSMRMVAVDFHDPRQKAWRVFFQGSAGGQTTYYLLAATLMQPQLNPPLADGLVVLYNGAAFPELDHIRFRGIVSAESVRPVVLRAIQGHHPAADGASG
jgi:hypothetical protein